MINWYKTNSLIYHKFLMKVLLFMGY